MSLSTLRDIGSHISAQQALAPVSTTGGTITGVAIDRAGTSGDQLFLSAQLVVNLGAASGTPTSFTVDATIQDSADGSTGWANLTPTSQTLTTMTTASTIGTKSFSLREARRYIRAVYVVAFTGGTSPAIVIGSTMVLGGASKLPTP